MVDPVIKPTIAPDLPALQQVLSETELFPADMLGDMIAPALAGFNADVWLTCHLDGAPVGLCYTAPEELAEGTWNMRAIAVLPGHQGKGLGAAMVAAIEGYLREKAARVLIVDTSGTDDFAMTRSFYASNGYTEEARIRDFWADGDDKVIFRKALG